MANLTLIFILCAPRPPRLSGSRWRARSVFSVVITKKQVGCCCLPAIAVDCPALKHMQIAADGRGGRVALKIILKIADLSQKAKR